MRIILKLFMVILSVVYIGNIHGASQSALYRMFWYPKFHQAPLSYCTSDNKLCGLKLGHAYCKKMGYQRAAQVIIDNNIGLANYFDCESQCQGYRCNGFKVIKCQGFISHKPPQPYYYRLKRFDYPRYHHYRVDWCYHKGKQCGERAAYSYCRRMGFTKAHAFEKESSVPATKALSDEKLCFGEKCHGFKSITCYR